MKNYYTVHIQVINLGKGEMSDRQESAIAGETGSRGELQDPMYDALGNKRRQLTLCYLIENDGEADFTELVTYVASQENSVPPPQITPAQKNRVRTSLYQHHLEKMEDCELISYRKRDGTIELEGDEAEIRQHLGYDRVSRQTKVGYGIGLINLGLAAGIYLLSSATVWIPILVGAVGTAQIILSFMLQGK